MDFWSASKDEKKLVIFIKFTLHKEYCALESTLWKVFLMTIELSYYLFVCTVGLVFCFKTIESDRFYFIFSFILFFIFSIITRYSGFDEDMNVYVSTFESNIFSIYYLKEPVYWVLSHYIYNFIKSPEITFIVYDLISFLLILQARKTIGLPQYFPFLFLLFFPAVMGFNNVFRQYLSYAVFLYFTSLLFIQSSFLKRSFYIVLAILTHNVSALFSPLFFTINKKKQISFRALTLYIIALTLLPLALGSKSNSDTGELAVEAYIIVMFFFIVFYALSYHMKFNDISAKLFYFMIYMLTLISVSAVVMGTGQSKRVGMYSLMVSLVPIVKAIEDNYKQKVYIRMVVYIVLILPTLFFTSSLNMLLT